MACFAISKVRIAGLAAAVPRQVESNLDYTWISEKDRKLLIRTTGIEFRRKAPAGMTAADLCQAAAEKLLQQLGWDHHEVDALVMVTQTPDYQMPATAMLLQDRLGLPKSCLSFDVNQGCAGYVYGLSILASLLQGGGLKKGLLLVGDTITHTISPRDKASAPIFSDAGSATALEFKEEASEMIFNLQSDGAGYQAIHIPEGGARNPLGDESLLEKEIQQGIFRAGNQMAMQGLDVFNFALREVVPNIRELLDFAARETDSVDKFIFHQANLLLNESLRKKLEIEPEKVPYSLREFGNTSCATIPVTLAACLREELEQKSLKMLFSGFGVGLSWGSVLLETERLVCPALIEL
ncbi:MAG: ketoacyl-ACP synthase III [Bacteroidia bacterium]|nr:ketoacyl-ACP synthase III [Bacteroidia bacterium]